MAGSLTSPLFMHLNTLDSGNVTLCRRGRTTFIPPLPRSSSSDDSQDEDVPTGHDAFDGLSEAGITPQGSTPQELVKLDPSEIGMSVGLKHLYGGKEDKRGRFRWKTEMPKNLGKPAEDAETEKWAIIVRHVKAYNDPKKVLRLHSIVIQSPLLKDLLKNVLDGYPGISVGLKRFELSGKFEPLIHRWTELKDAISKLKDDGSQDAADKLKHAELLRNLIADEFKDVIETSLDMRSQGVMTYDNLWTLFQPDSFVYNKQQGQDRIFKLQSAWYGADRNGNPVFWLMCQYVDWDGSSWGTSKINVCIPAYEGTLPINSLLTFPVEFHADEVQLKKKLIERGDKVEKLAGSHYRAYNGVGWRIGISGRKEIYSIKGRIVIDGYGWNRFNPEMTVILMPIISNRPLGLRESSNSRRPGDFIQDPLYEEGYDGGMPLDGFFADEEDSGETKASGLTDEQRMICSPLVRGYALKEKMWLNFFVNAVQDVSFSTKAFESLVLPEHQKELILGFTATQQSYRSHFDDFVQGKGRGIILLLCGPPGVGKTLTAESVAEEMKVPLFVMSAGDLGLDPDFVESKLQGILDMCTRWNAILLLDEADVFLEQRSLHELERNKLVSVFLRVLEYFEGIMFLTTNRVQTFDAAFQSRIHISLEYPELDVKSRKRVWLQFLGQHDLAQASARATVPKPLPSAARSSETVAVDEKEVQKQREELLHKQTLPHAMTPTDITRLSQLPMNGRQIKNILKTAQLLASKRGEGLGYEHVKTVMEMTQHLHNSTQENERTRSSLFS